MRFRTRLRLEPLERRDLPAGRGRDIPTDDRYVPPATALTPLASSYLGGAAGDDAVTGSAIQADGTVVLAARIGDANPGNVTARLLNGATAASRGAIVRLAADGKRVLSVTRLADTVTDLSTDAAGNLYVATGATGLLKLNATATTVVWAKAGSAFRVDAGLDGDVAALGGSGFAADGSGFTNAGTITVYDAAGTQLGSFATFAGRGTYDVALDGGRDSVFSTGFLQTSGGGNPVQISYLRSQGYDGAIKWSDYNWSGSQVDGIGETNNMADTRGLRLDVGADGRLYAAFQCAGGNHIFRYSPKDVSVPVTIVGGDYYHEFYNTSSEHKTFFARYDAATGDYLTGQQFTGRLPNTKGNSINLNKGGDIQADATGRMYLSGASAWGMPIGFDPLAADAYQGGSFVLVMSADFRTRLFSSRFTTGGTNLTVAARIMPGEGIARVVFGGSSGNTLWTDDAVQPTFGGGTLDGQFGVLGVGKADLATGRATTASSSFGGYGPNRATDGSQFTGYRSAAADGQWVTVDLGAARTVSNVVIAWGANYAKGFRVQFSADGVTWRDRYSSTTATGGTSTVAAGGVARYVRVMLDTRATAATGFDVLELSVWGD